MPDNARTPDAAISQESRTPSAMMDPENHEEVSAPVSQAPTPSDSTPSGANVDQQPRVEVTCGGCRRGLRIRGDYLGRFVICQFCGSRFLARIEVGRPGD